MKINNISKWLTGSLMTAALAAGISACSDDHFDISSAASGKHTIWENIQNNSQLSEYADILQRVYYSETEKKTSTKTYADLLNGEQTFTVWAPQNGTFDYNSFDNILKNGTREDIYQLEKEFIRNTMARYNYTMNGTGEKQIELFNSKSATIDLDNHTIGGVQATPSSEPTSNGLLYVMRDPISYQPNLYEYIASREDLSMLKDFLKSFEKTEFYESASTEGPTIDGVKTWVDSVTYSLNTYTDYYMNAYLDREDSCYAMIMPTNTVWTALLENTKRYYHFKSMYKQDVNTQTEAGADTTIEGKITSFTEEELDSLTNFYANNAICQNLAFNANWQFNKKPISTIEEINAADSLRTTAGTKFKKTGTLNQTNRYNVIEADNYGDLFGGEDPVKVSNGYAYVQNNINWPYQIYAPTIDELYPESKDNQAVVSRARMTYDHPVFVYPAENEGEEDIRVTYDSTFVYDFYKVMPFKTTSQPGAYFKLTDVLSCKYDIYVVINYNTDVYLPNSFYVQLYYDLEDKRVSSPYQFSNPDLYAKDGKGKYFNQQTDKEGNVILDESGNPIIKNDKHFINKGIHLNEQGQLCYTDTILVAKDFEFPVSYYGISNDAYPVVYIKSNFSNQDRAYYSREIWVNSIILKPKDWALDSANADDDTEE